ncbi:MAG: hypothetical protein ABIR83_09705, partial [Nakamurella sp.]
LDDVPGRDQYDARGDELRSMARILVGLQVTWTERVPELESLGLMDKRASAVPRGRPGARALRSAVELTTAMPPR